jgi:hypothetical protein
VRHVNTVAVVSGPLVLLGYLSLATTRWYFARWRKGDVLVPVTRDGDDQ